MLSSQRQLVRAHRDPALQEIQKITRMSPSALLQDDGTIRRRFEALVRDNIAFVNNWSHPRITPQTQRMYSKRKPVNKASAEYVQGCRVRLDQERVTYTVSRACDMQRPEGSRSEFVQASDPDIVSALDTKIRESRTLIFWPGALVSSKVDMFVHFIMKQNNVLLQFESTQSGDGYSQSQLLILIDVPTNKQVSSRSSITLYASPLGQNEYTLDEEVPTEEQLLSMDWTKVEVGIAIKQYIT